MKRIIVIFTWQHQPLREVYNIVYWIMNLHYGAFYVTLQLIVLTKLYPILLTVKSTIIFLEDHSKRLIPVCLCQTRRLNTGVFSFWLFWWVTWCFNLGLWIYTFLYFSSFAYVHSSMRITSFFSLPHIWYVFVMALFHKYINEK